MPVKNFQDIVEFFLSKNIPITLMTSETMPTGAREAAKQDFPNVKCWYALPGFYKSGYLYLCDEGKQDEEVSALDRYGVAFRNQPYDNVIELVLDENIHWLQSTQERNPNSVITPDSLWVDLLVKSNRIKTRVETRISYTF